MEERSTQVFWGRDEEDSKGKNQLEDPNVDGRINLDRTLQRQDARAST